MLSKIIPFLLLFCILSGCSLHSSSTYDHGEMGAPAYFKKGVILSVRDIKIKGRESGVPTPANDAAVEFVKRLERRELVPDPINVQRLESYMATESQNV